MISKKVLPCNFVGDFKVGDNLVHNCRILSELVIANEAGLLNKLVVLQVCSILEACLAEIIFRTQNFNLEGVANISESDRREIEGKKLDKFSAVIDVMKKYHILDTLGEEVYDELHRLRKYRNKIHIQDDVAIEGVSRDEPELFSDELTQKALDLNFRVINCLVDRYPRSEDVGSYVSDLTIPVPL